mmetsp:Transcript_3701/g.9401  ORF Transcript_3701/g.9401 Transcript_3701/m.9401 type:complete len:214 (+) Transcript_3701:310-951(+)
MFRMRHYQVRHYAIHPGGGVPRGAERGELAEDGPVLTVVHVDPYPVPSREAGCEGSYRAAHRHPARPLQAILLGRAVNPAKEMPVIQVHPLVVVPRGNVEEVEFLPLTVPVDEPQYLRPALEDEELVVGRYEVRIRGMGALDELLHDRLPVGSVLLEQRAVAHPFILQYVEVPVPNDLDSHGVKRAARERLHDVLLAERRCHIPREVPRESAE